MSNRLTDHPLLGYAFRPMFVGLAGFAVLGMAVWVSGLTGIIADFRRYSPLWHGHEMLFGFALAAVAGFVLTAVATWTGRPPVRRGLLLALALAWLGGRAAMLLGAYPAAWIACVALVYPVMLTLIAGHEIVRGGSRRNYLIVAVLGSLALLDLVHHLGSLGVLPGVDRGALLAALYLLLVLVAVIAGRIVPSFTANWLRGRDAVRLPQTTPAVERLIAPFTAATGVLAVIFPSHPATGIAAALTALAHAVRLARWRGHATLAEPLVFILHVAYAWLPIGFALLAASILVDAEMSSSALHAFGVGAIGTMILAVTTRVALGHTGRPLAAAPSTVVAYLLLSAAVVFRILAPAAGANYLNAIGVAAIAWIGAWSLFLWTYTPMLVRPRIAPGPG